MDLGVTATHPLPGTHGAEAKHLFHPAERHSLLPSAPVACRYEHEPAHELGPAERQLLGDEAAQRAAQYVSPSRPEVLEESHLIGGDPSDEVPGVPRKRYRHIS